MFNWFDNKKARKDVSLVLSTGGARGLAHIGAIDQLESMGYNIRAVAGTSMGALVGGMYAAGRLDDFKEWMLTIDRKKIPSLLDFSLSISHIAKGERIINAMKKVVPDAPHEVLLVIDGSTGQNGFLQAKEFTRATDVTALAVTKLDGSAKGGVVIGISDQFKIPIKFIGVGEKIEDLKLFDKKEFVESLFE
jgi:predicted acylesterase/phospholipase RssA